MNELLKRYMKKYNLQLVVWYFGERWKMTINAPNASVHGTTMQLAYAEGPMYEDTTKELIKRLRIWLKQKEGTDVSNNWNMPVLSSDADRVNA